MDRKQEVEDKSFKAATLLQDILDWDKDPSSILHDTFNDEYRWALHYAVGVLEKERK